MGKKRKLDTDNDAKFIEEVPQKKIKTNGNFQECEGNMGAGDLKENVDDKDVQGKNGDIVRENLKVESTEGNIEHQNVGQENGAKEESSSTTNMSQSNIISEGNSLLNTQNGHLEEKIVGTQLVKHLERPLFQVEEFEPWSLEDTLAQNVIQQEKKLQLEQLTTHKLSIPPKRKRSDWDKQLDKGRLKKVKKPKINEQYVNRFQQLSNRKIMNNDDH